MSNITHIINYMLESKKVLEEIATDEKIQKEISKAAEIMIAAIHNGNKIITCGNGGSMADAMHFSAELTGRYKSNRRPLASIALCDPVAMSCITNDFQYSQVFSRQILAMATQGDVLLAISTSGKSPNICQAIYDAKSIDIDIIALTGKSPSKTVIDHCDVTIKVPSYSTNYIQEAHMAILHVLVELIEKEFN